MADDMMNGGLTKELLAEQNELFRQGHNTPGSWVERVVHDERMHLFHSQVGMSFVQDREQVGSNNLSMQLVRGHHKDGTPTHRGHEGQTYTSLKLFKTSQGAFQESPLERFLTPDGCSDPSFFARPALAKMEIPFGSAETIEERKRKAKRNAEMAKKKERKAGEKRS